MKTRNPKYNVHGTIDCEIEHPIYGWIPFTASPDDVEQHGKDIHEKLIADGNIADYVAHVKTAEQITAELEMAKESKKTQLIQTKMSVLLSAEFAEIEAATTNAEIEGVKLK